MKAAPGIAIVLALIAIVLGVIAIMNCGGSDPERLTLQLTETKENERALDVGREPALVFESPVTGDRTGTLAGACLPAGDDGIGCIATYSLEDGTITTQNIRTVDEPTITSAIIGGTGAYEGAGGTRTIPDPESSEHTLNLLLPAE